MNKNFDKNEYFKEYRKNNLTQLSAAIPKDIADAFKTKLERDGKSFSSFLKDAIKQYLDKE